MLLLVHIIYGVSELFFFVTENLLHRGEHYYCDAYDVNHIIIISVTLFMYISVFVVTDILTRVSVIKK